MEEKKIELGWLNAQIYFYAKGFYQKGIMMDDLKVIISKVCRVPIEMVDVFDIYRVVTDFFDEVRKVKPFKYFWKDLERLFRNKGNQNYINIEELIEDMLGYISIAELKYFNVNIMKPDYDILPKKSQNS